MRSDIGHTTRPVIRFGGIVLAGGRSSRMGRPKAWLPVGDRTMLATVAGAVAEGLRGAGSRLATAPQPAGPIVIVGAPGQDLPPAGLPVLRVDDDVEGEGPLRGLAAGLGALTGKADAAYVSSCDVPLLKPAFVARMIALLGDADIAVPLVDDRHHPLAAVYRIGVLETVRDLLARNQRRPFFLFERRPTRVVTATDLLAADPGLDSLRNFNTPEEYDRLLAGGGASSGAGAAAAGSAATSVVFEFYGVARLRSGRERIEVGPAATTLGAALTALERACPSLSGTVLEAGRLGRHFRLSLNGGQFVSAPDQPLAAGDTLVVLSAEVGG